MSDIHNIRLIITDVDGVLTNGKITHAGDRTEIKEFNVRDGLGVKLAQRSGITVAVLTSRKSPALERRARELGILEIHQGAKDKLVEAEKLINRLGFTHEQVLYAGDDLPDLGPMTRAAISAAPADAAPEVLQAATWKLEARGGEGAFREIVERLLRERGEWEAVVREFAIGKPEAGSI